MKYQNGNALFLILIAVALFAALSYAVTQSTSTQKGIDGEKLSLYANDVLEFAQAVKTGTNFIYTNNGIGEGDIRFAHPDLSALYGNPSSLDPNQMVFHQSGGGVQYKKAPAAVNDGSDWLFTGKSCVANIGTGGNSCNSNSAEIDLIAILPNVTQEFCIAINKRLGVTNPSDVPPKDQSNGYDPTTGQFAGSFSANYRIGDAGGVLTGKSAACFEGGGTPAAGTYHFYQVLLER